MGWWEKEKDVQASWRRPLPHTRHESCDGTGIERVRFCFLLVVFQEWTLKFFQRVVVPSQLSRGVY